MPWQNERVIFSGAEWFDSMEDAISRAEHSIILETYIFENDGVGQRILRALAAAAARGVRVRLLVDGFGSYNWHVAMGLKFSELGFEVRVYHPMPSLVVRWNSTWLISLQRAIKMFSRLNRRTHRKLFVADDSLAWVGSWNITATHLGVGGAPWRDAGCVVSGDCVHDLMEIFERAWERSFSPLLPGFRTALKRIQAGIGRQPFRTKSGKFVFFTDFGKSRKIFRSEIFSRLQQSTGRVWLATAYFVPVPKLVRALLLASRAGSDVRVLVPARSDIPPARWLGWVFYEELLKGGVRIFEYQPSMLHEKMMLLEDRAFVGSLNLNFRSFYHDNELAVALVSEHALNALASQYEVDLAASREIFGESGSSMPLWQKIVGFLLFRVRFWF